MAKGGRPIELDLRMAAYLLKQKMKGNKKFPLTMILEPLEACNLSCEGCGRILEYVPVIDQYMTVEAALRAVDDCEAPVVSIAGGEPLMHPRIGDIVAGIIQRKKFVYLCSNALLMKRAMKQIPPSKHFAFVVHLDGLEETHDISVARKGVYKVAIEMIRTAIEKRYRVLTNTTLFKGTRPEEFHQLFTMLTDMGVEGLMVTPAFDYKEVADKDIFMQREQARAFFQEIFAGANGARFYNNPLYLDFLLGKREYQCSPWTTPTYTVMGWRKPCYLLSTEGHADTFQELIADTNWDRWGFGRDSRCNNCMMHCGYEGSAIIEAMEKPKVALELARRSIFNSH